MDGYTEIIVVPDSDPREYWCPTCMQLRLSARGEPDVCGNCGNGRGLIIGRPGELDADALRAQPKGA